MAQDFNPKDELVILQAAPYPNIQRWVIHTEREAGGIRFRNRVSGYEVFVFTNGNILTLDSNVWQSAEGITEREEIATQSGNFGAQIIEYYSFDEDEQRQSEQKFSNLQNKYAAISAAAEAATRPAPEPEPGETPTVPRVKKVDYRGWEIVEDIMTNTFLVPALGNATFDTLPDAKAAIDAEMTSQEEVEETAPKPDPGPTRDVGLEGMSWRDYYAKYYEDKGEGINPDPNLVFAQMFTNTIRNFRRGDEENTIEIRTTAVLNDDFLKVVVNPQYNVALTVSIVGDKGPLSKEESLFASSSVTLSGGDSMEFDFKDFETGVAKAGISVNGEQVLDMAVMNEYGKRDDVRIVVTLKGVTTSKPPEPDPSPFEEAGVTAGMVIFVIAFAGILFLANRRAGGDAI